MPQTGTNGAAFRSAREAAGLDSLRALARHLGIDYSYLSRWERGEAGMSPERQALLEQALEDFKAGRWSPAT